MGLILLGLISTNRVWEELKEDTRNIPPVPPLIFALPHCLHFCTPTVLRLRLHPPAPACISPRPPSSLRAPSRGTALLLANTSTNAWRRSICRTCTAPRALGCLDAAIDPKRVGGSKPRPEGSGPDPARFGPENLIEVVGGRSTSQMGLCAGLGRL